MASPPLPSLLSLIFSFSLITLSLSSKPTTTTITIPLSPSHKTTTKINTNPFQRLNQLTSSSLTRAHHLKHPQHKNNSSSSLSKTPLSPQSYGGYSISLGFGSPPQTLSFIMDTGSSLVWFPCTQRYLCTRCDFPNVNPQNIHTFMPKLSSSAKIVGCKNPKCGLIFDPDSKPECEDCDKTSTNCTQICPPYAIQYGSGSTSGLLLSETLNLPNRIVNDFVVGCSIFSTRQPSGIAGFGRGPSSLPDQLGLKKFSYCLVSHRFDDTPVSSDLVLVGGSDSGAGKSAGYLGYTPLLKNPLKSNSAFQEYYYVGLRRITVGGRKVKIPFRFLVPGLDGDGGTIIDSGTTFTFMERRVFELVAKEFETQVAAPRATDVEARSGLRPCFNVSGEKTLSLPELVFHFKGGAEMVLPLADYFSLFGDVSTLCMTIVTDGVVGPAMSGGPAIILGNYQQQNFLLEYDLENERLGFRKQICK